MVTSLRVSHRFLALVGLILIGLVCESCPIPQTAPATSNDRGFVFLEGKYVAPPYYVDIVGGDVRINRRVVRPGKQPPETTGTPEPSPSTPQNAGDLITVAANALREKKLTSYQDITPQVRAELVSLIKSYPVAAQVTDEVSSIVATDKAGNDARLRLLRKADPPAEEVLNGQRTLASSWRRLLETNGVLLLTSSAAEQIAPDQAGTFLTALLEALAEPADVRAARLDKLVRAPSISRSLLAAGPPPAAVRSRIPKVRPTQQPSPPSRGAYAMANQSLGPVGDALSHRLSHTPKSREVVLMHTLNNTSESVAIAEAAVLQGYNVTILTSGYGSGPGDVTVDRFLETSGDVGVLYLDAHGDRNTISIEQYRFRSDRDRALAAYRARGIPVGEDIVEGSIRFPIVRTSNYTIDINRQTIARWKGSATIVELSTCQGSDLADAFLRSGAREVLASNDTLGNVAAKAFNDEFWPRMAGTKDNGTSRNVIDAYKPSSTGSSFKHKGDGKTVLSPAVAKYSPQDGETLTVGVKVKATVTFDVPMDTRFLPVWDLKGSCKPIFIYGPSTHPGEIGWENDRTFVFSFVPQQAGDIEVDVGGGNGIAWGGENEVALDGNQNPPHTDHVGPNGDSFVWHLKCAGTLPKSSPTRTPPQAACSGSVQLISDQFFPDRVKGSNPAEPTFNTGGKKYCLTEVATYHWNDGRGAPEGGTITLVGPGGKVLGPFKAMATAGTGGALVNWEAMVSTNPPVILDGSYTVKDSQPATWSWSDASGGKGFVRVWASEYKG